MDIVIGILLYMRVITASSTVTMTEINKDLSQHMPDVSRIMQDSQMLDRIMQTYQQDISTIIVIDDTAIR